MIKRLGMWLSSALMLAMGTASADPTYCIPSLTTTIATVGVPPRGESIVCGQVTLSNFTDAGNSPNAFLVYVTDTTNILNGSRYDPVTGEIFLLFNPNLNNNQVFQDVHVTFNVTTA